MEFSTSAALPGTAPAEAEAMAASSRIAPKAEAPDWGEREGEAPEWWVNHWAEAPDAGEGRPGHEDHEFTQGRSQS